MKRKLDGLIVRQSSLTQMFNVNDLVEGFNEMRKAQGLTEKRIQHYWDNEATKEFLIALENEIKLNSRNSGELKMTRRGKNGGTWVTSEVFVDIAMWLNPRFKAKVMIWVTDNLLGIRNTTGIQQQVMNRELKAKFSHKTTKFLLIRFNQRINKYILEKDEDWQIANSSQLEVRLELQRKIINACDLLPDGISEDEFCKKVFKIKSNKHVA